MPPSSMNRSSSPPNSSSRYASIPMSLPSRVHRDDFSVLLGDDDEGAHGPSRAPVGADHTARVDDALVAAVGLAARLGRGGVPEERAQVDAGVEQALAPAAQ